MADTSRPGEIAALPRVLGTRDLVLLNIAAIVGLRMLASAAKLGPSSLVLWAVGLVIFFVPLALAVLELSSRLPGEGGFYLWTKAAFGDGHGFVAGWTYWISNIVFFPTLLLFGAGAAAYVGGDRWTDLAADFRFNASYCLAALWGATALNILGLDRAKWLQNAGGIATWSAAAMLVAAGGVAWSRFGSATASENVIPDFKTLATLSALASMALAYQGMELGPILGGEIKDPRRQIPRAMLISGVFVAIIYMAGTAALLVALPAEKIDLIGGISQALVAIGQRLGFPAFGAIVSALIALGSLGGICTWIAGTARLPFVVGLDRYLPSRLSRLHPRYGTPHVALLTQGTLTTMVLLGALTGSTLHEAFVILVDMTIILGFLPLLYIFAALPVLRRRGVAESAGPIVIPGGVTACWLVSAVGFLTTLLAIFTSMLPPAESQEPGLFYLKVVGGSVVLIGIGLIFYLSGRGRRDVAAD